jgi:hypothetical protein
VTPLKLRRVAAIYIFFCGIFFFKKKCRSSLATPKGQNLFIHGGGLGTPKTGIYPPLQFFFFNKKSLKTKKKKWQLFVAILMMPRIGDAKIRQF